MTFIDEETKAPYEWVLTYLGRLGARHRYTVEHKVPGKAGWVETTVFAHNRVQAAAIAHQAGCLVASVNMVG